MSLNDAPNGAPDNAPDNPQGFGTPPPYQGQPYQGQPYPGGPYGTAPGTYGSAPSQLGRPPTYLGWAITAAVGGVLFSLILGLPTGLVATRYARKVRTAWDAGDQYEAAKASKRALTWSIVSTCLDILGLILVIYLVSHPASSTG